MSILGMLVKSAAKQAAKVAGFNAIVNSSKKKSDKFFDKEPGTEVLVIGGRIGTIKDTLDVFDENKDVKYVVKGRLTSIKQHLLVYHASGGVVGSIKQKLIALRMPYFHDINRLI